MDKKLIALVFVLILFVMPFVYADKVETDVIIQLQQQRNLSISCDLNGWLCPATVSCISSLQYPNQTFAFFNKSVPVNGNFVTVPLFPNNTDILGDYPMDIKCRDSASGLNSSVNFILRVTTTGTEISITQSILYVIVFAVSLFIFLMCLWSGINMKTEHHRDEDGFITILNEKKYVKYMLFAFSYLLFIWIVWLTKQISLAYFDIEIGTKLLNLVFTALLWSIIPAFVFVFMILLLNFLSDRELFKALDRGLSVR